MRSVVVYEESPAIISLGGVAIFICISAKLHCSPPPSRDMEICVPRISYELHLPAYSECTPYSDRRLHTRRIVNWIRVESPKR